MVSQAVLRGQHISGVTPAPTIPFHLIPNTPGSIAKPPIGQVFSRPPIPAPSPDKYLDKTSPVMQAAQSTLDQEQQFSAPVTGAVQLAIQQGQLNQQQSEQSSSSTFYLVIGAVAILGGLVYFYST